VPKIYHRAFSFRQFLKKEFPLHLPEFPLENPLSLLDFDCIEKSGQLQISNLGEQGPVKLTLPSFIDQSIFPVERFPGGCEYADDRLVNFLENKLKDYSRYRSHPEKNVTSGLSPYLHHGHISPHGIFRRIALQEEWSPEKMNSSKKGKHWFGLSENAEMFLDELITWRELGYNMASQDPSYDEYDSLPDWAKQTLKEHADDPRKFVYSIKQLENAETHDPLWNAAQNQLCEEGIIHNYLRMLWGKKILEWSENPKTALEIMIHLNNKYALDGRNPNSYSGIFWILGRYDRPWGPVRPVFGKIRYMSSKNTQRKFQTKDYIRKYNG
jgi:deoxyribodipyrimidine photo-lyase